MKKLLIACFVIQGIIACQTLSAQGLNNPWGIAYDNLSMRYLVSNEGTNSITRIDSQGNASSFAQFGSLNRPKGLEISGETLFVANTNGIVAYSLQTNMRIFDILINGALSIGDVEDDGMGSLYASDTDAGRIYKITLDGQVVSVFADNLDISPKGILYDGAKNRLLVSSAGDNKIISINTVTKSIMGIFSASFSDLSGMALDNCGNIYVASKDDNSVYVFDENFQNPPTKIAEGLNSPADISIVTDSQVLAVTNSTSNNLSFTNLNMDCAIPGALSPANNAVLPFCTVVFNWLGVVSVGAPAYEVEYSIDSAFISGVCKLQATSDYSSPVVLTPNTKYYWRVRTVGGPGKDIFGTPMNFTTGQTAAIEENNLSVATRIYPNPAADYIYCDQATSGSVITIASLLGSQVKSLTTEMTGHPGKVAVSDMDAGLYIVSIRKPSGEVYTGRFEIVK